MAEMKHTPGPWAARGKYVFAGGDCIGICDTDNASDGRMEANAHLISAAPDMYEALKGFVAKLDTAILVEGDHPTSHLADELRAALAALAKAEGRSND